MWLFKMRPCSNVSRIDDEFTGPAKWPNVGTLITRDRDGRIGPVNK